MSIEQIKNAIADGSYDPHGTKEAIAIDRAIADAERTHVAPLAPDYFARRAAERIEQDLGGEY